MPGPPVESYHMYEGSGIVTEAGEPNTYKIQIVCSNQFWHDDLIKASHDIGIELKSEAKGEAVQKPVIGDEGLKSNRLAIRIIPDTNLTRNAFQRRPWTVLVEKYSDRYQILDKVTEPAYVYSSFGSRKAASARPMRPLRKVA